MSVSRLSVLVGTILLASSSATLAQDPGDMVLRIGRLENQLREMAGQIEQLQHDNRRLAEQVRKFQDDVEFRFQEKGGTRTQSQSGLPTPGQGRGQTSLQASSQQGQGLPQRPGRGDAFDPASNPNAQGVPKPLGSRQSASVSPGGISGTIPKGAIEVDDTNDDLPPGTVGGPTARGDQDGRPLELGAKEPIRERAAPGPQQQPQRSAPSAAVSGDARQDYEGAYASLLQRQYDQAEMGFRAFLQSHPRDKLVPDATYWLGESFYQRRRFREAAEQFLKVTTDYAASPKASDGMLKLGMALNGMGEREKACGTYGEVLRKFPTMREAADREKRNAKC